MKTNKEDAIETLCERFNFNKTIMDNGKVWTIAQAHLMKAYIERYDQSPPDDIVKDLLGILLKISPEWVKFDLTFDLGEDVKQQVFERVKDKVFNYAIEQMKGWK